MKKIFVSVFVMAVMATGSVLTAQDVEATLDQAAETVEAAVVEGSSPAEEEAPVAVDAQESVSDGVAMEPAEVSILPVASEVIFDAGVVVGGGMPIQSMAPSCCNSCNACCQQPSFVQPVVFNQPVFQESVISQAVPATQVSASSIVTAAPMPATPVYSQPATSGCSSCSGGAVVNYAPATTSYAATPVASSYAPTPVASYAPAPVVASSYAPATTSYTAAPVESSYIAAPVASSGCSSCGGSVATSSNACCQQRSGLFQRGGGNFSRLRRGVFIGRLIAD